MLCQSSPAQRMLQNVLSPLLAFQTEITDCLSVALIVSRMLRSVIKLGVWPRVRLLCEL